MIRSSSVLQFLGVSAALALAVYAAPYSAPASELYTYHVAGGGGAIPALGSGGGGAWPDTLPPSAFVSSLTLPEYATTIEEIEINGLAHASCGDLQIVLFDPNGVGHNLVHRVGFGATSEGYRARLSGDFGLLDADHPEVTHAWPQVDPGPNAILSGGDYPIEFGDSWGGAWPSGAAGIENSQMSAIPVVPGGEYTLVIYDWRFDGKGSCTSWGIEGLGLAALPRTYCTSGVSVAACTPAISANVNPTIGVATPCVVTVEGVPAAASGMVMYGIDNTGYVPKPVAGSSNWLCVRAPLARTTLLDSGGAAACDGRLVFDWTSYQAANPGALGQPWMAGREVYLQAFIRDGGATVNSDAVELTYHP